MTKRMTTDNPTPPPDIQQPRDTAIVVIPTRLDSQPGMTDDGIKTISPTTPPESAGLGADTGMFFLSSVHVSYLFSSPLFIYHCLWLGCTYDSFSCGYETFVSDWFIGVTFVELRVSRKREREVSLEPANPRVRYNG